MVTAIEVGTEQVQYHTKVESPPNGVPPVSDLEALDAERELSFEVSVSLATEAVAALADVSASEIFERSATEATPVVKILPAAVEIEATEVVRLVEIKLI